ILIQDDNLQMSEIQVWENVLKWGLAQNLELPSDVENFSKEDFNTLKNNLQQCIPFIRFYNLTSEEFSDRVLPYEDILPKELYKKAAEHGKEAAQYNLGRCYKSGIGVKKDNIKAFECYKKSAENGNINAQIFLGYAYCFGKGEKDLEKAICWWQKAANNGDEI